MPGVISLNGTYKGKIVPITYNKNDDLFYVQIGDNDYIPIEGTDLNKFGINYKEWANILNKSPLTSNFYYNEAEALVKKYGGVLRTRDGFVQTYQDGKKVEHTGQEYIRTPYYVNINGETRPVYLSSSKYDPNGRAYTLVASEGNGNFTPISNQTYSNLADLKTQGMPDDLNYYNNKITSYDNKVTANTELINSIADSVINSTKTNSPNYLSGLTDATVDTSEINSIKANQPKLMSASELAELYGLNYDYDYILGVLNEGTDAYLKEMTEKAKQIQQDTLRNQVGLYYQYLDALREQRANAVNSGINRGTQAAQELSQYLMSQQQITQQLSDSNAEIYDLYNKAITEKAKNKYTALQDYNTLGTQLMSGSAQLNANDVQRYTADLGAAAQVASANATARAQENAARYGAQAQVDSASIYNGMTNAILNNPVLLDQWLQSIKAQTANTNAGTDYYKAQTEAAKNANK